MPVPRAAEEKNGGRDEINGEGAGGAALASRSDFGGAWRNVFAVPEAPRVTPFPAASSGSSEAPGRQVPRYELAAGYSYVNFRPGSPFDSFSNQGGSGSFTYNASRYLGLTAELSGYNFSRDVSGANVQGGWTTWLFGPVLNLGRSDYFVPLPKFLMAGVDP